MQMLHRYVIDSAVKLYVKSLQRLNRMFYKGVIEVSMELGGAQAAVV